MKQKLYKPLHKGVFRVPAFPIEIFYSVFKDEQPDKVLKSILEFYRTDHIFREIVYLYSPTFSHLVDEKLNQSKVKLDDKIIFTLASYLLRSIFRATPFGVSAGVGTFTLGDDRDGALKLTSRYRSLILDNFKASQIWNSLRTTYTSSEYILNDTLYQKGNFLYYTKIKNQFTYPEYEEAFVEIDSFLQNILKKYKGISFHFDDLREFVSNMTNAGEEDLLEYLKELIDESIIIPLGNIPSLYEEYFLKVIRNSSLSDKYDVLESIKNTIASKNGSFLEEDLINTYTDIDKQLVSKLGILSDGTPSIRANLYLNADGQISKSEAERHFKLLNFLLKVHDGRFSNRYSKFKERFKSRYEQQEVPLLEVLNTELGLGYLNNNKGEFGDGLSELLFLYKSDTVEINLSSFELYLLSKINECIATGNSMVTIDENFVKNKKVNFSRLQNTINLPLTYVLENGVKKYLVLPTGNISAVNLLSRYSENKDILELCNELGKADKYSDDNFQNLEFSPFVNFKSLNVQCKNGKRDGTISLFTESNGNEVLLEDILIGNYGDTIYLKNKKNGKLVIPHTSTALNLSSNDSITAFISDFQQEHCFTPLMCRWGTLEKLFDHFPRLEYDSYILIPETWFVYADDFEHLFNIEDDGLLHEIKPILEKFAIRRNVLIVDDDNELPIDFENIFITKLFLSLLKRKKKLRLCENILIKSTNIIEDIERQRYVNQVIFSYKINEEIKQKIENNKRKVISKEAIDSTRTFLPFDDRFLYIQIYGGQQLMDIFLFTFLIPELNKVNKWFFIRYGDPSYHLRIRIFFTEGKQKVEFMRNVKAIFEMAKEKCWIYNVKFSTYDRELERYKYISEVENLFHYDTLNVAKLLGIKKILKEKNSYFFLSCWYISRILQHYLTGNPNRVIDILETMCSRLFFSLKISSKSKVSFDMKYRKYKSVLEDILTSERCEEVSLDNLQILFPEINGNKTLEENILISVIHMSTNRLFTFNQNLNEVVVYYFLLKYYKSIYNRKN